MIKLFKKKNKNKSIKEIDMDKAFNEEIKLTCFCGQELLKLPIDEFMVQFDDEETLEDYQNSFIKRCPHCHCNNRYKDFLSCSRNEFNNTVMFFKNQINK